MIITNKKYVIATKDFSLKFIFDGCETDDFEYADFYDTKQEAEDLLKETFDEPQEYQILEVEVSYKF